jgi:hypothetical protein
LRDVSSRRGLLRGLVVACGLATIQAPDAMEAKSKKKLKRNEHGCVNVGGKCRGKDKHCCSGRCRGTKPKKGGKDKSRCVAHDTGTLAVGEGGCRAEHGSPLTACTNTAGELGRCSRTTGNAGFCGQIPEVCLPQSCRKDADCIDACGAGAACTISSEPCDGGVFRVCTGISGCDGS